MYGEMHSAKAKTTRVWEQFITELAGVVPSYFAWFERLAALIMSATSVQQNKNQLIFFGNFCWCFGGLLCVAFVSVEGQERQTCMEAVWVVRSTKKIISNNGTCQDLLQPLVLRFEQFSFGDFLQIALERLLRLPGWRIGVPTL